MGEKRSTAQLYMPRIFPPNFSNHFSNVQEISAQLVKQE